MSSVRVVLQETRFVEKSFQCTEKDDETTGLKVGLG